MIDVALISSAAVAKVTLRRMKLFFIVGDGTSFVMRVFKPLVKIWLCSASQHQQLKMTLQILPDFWVMLFLWLTSDKIMLNALNTSNPSWTPSPPPRPFQHEYSLKSVLFPDQPEWRFFRSVIASSSTFCNQTKSKLLSAFSQDILHSIIQYQTSISPTKVLSMLQDRLSPVLFFPTVCSLIFPIKSNVSLFIQH